MREERKQVRDIEGQRERNEAEGDNGEGNEGEGDVRRRIQELNLVKLYLVSSLIMK